MIKNKSYIKEDEEVDTSNCWFISPQYNKDHPAVFPKELCSKIIKRYSFEEDIVLDPFAGSGTVGKVAKELNRKYVLCEQNEEYFDNLLQWHSSKEYI